MNAKKSKKGNKKRFPLMFLILFLSGIIIIGAGVLAFYAKNSKLIYFQKPVIVLKQAAVTYVIGDAVIQRGNKEFKARPGYKLKNGDTITLKDKAIVDIKFNDQYAIRLKDKAKFTLDEFNIEKINNTLSRGSFFAKFSKILKNSSTSVSTPTAVAGVRGTAFAISVNDDQSSEIKVLNGIVEAHNPLFPEEKRLLPDGYKSVVLTNEIPKEPQKMDLEEIYNLSLLINQIHFETVLIILEKVEFKFGTAKILPSAYSFLDKAAEIIKTTPGIKKIRIDGHTDNIGSDTENQKLSEKRALSVKNYLVQKGIKERKLKIKGWGELRPNGDNSTAEGRRMNRRVEFVVIN